MSKLDAEDRGKLPKREFAFPEQRKEPLEDATHVAERDRALQPGQGRYRCRARRGLEAHRGGRGEVWRGAA